MAGMLPRCWLQVAFKFVPSRETFLTHLGGDGGPQLMADMATFSGDFAKLLAEVHSFIVSGRGRLCGGQRQGQRQAQGHRHGRVAWQDSLLH